MNNTPNGSADVSGGSAATWLPIETATKDGTRLLLWAAGSAADEIEVGYWSTSIWTYGGGWIHCENRSDTVVLKPTHWMPLPMPPNAPGELRQIAYHIANDLFTSGGGSGRRAARLVLENEDGSNGGGWCFKSAVKQIGTHLSNDKLSHSAGDRDVASGKNA